ncbi:hypothetical protein FF38_05461 [Lucilia cuprina]|uniref:Uncharacterized protein n=1 Tax=Lucilia cuprina TaxID=7375 RepID=A0A0L0C0G6_LUCCU|nr:hypothetical protein FF38_05461 [Lucilia cuprina]
MIKTICLLVLLICSTTDSLDPNETEDYEIVIPDDINTKEEQNVYELSIVSDKESDSMDIYVVNVAPKSARKSKELNIEKIPKTPKRRRGWVAQNCKCIIRNRCADSDDCVKNEYYS